jgi:hypothetical protein
MDWNALAALGESRHGVVILRDAPRLGLSPKALSEFGRRQGLQRPYPSVLLMPGAPHTFAQCCAIAVGAAGGERVLVSRRAAAHLHGVERDPPATIELVVPGDRHVSLADLALPVAAHHVTVWRSSTLLRADAGVADRIPVTVPARTAIDLAAVLTLDELRAFVIDARQRRLVTLADIRRLHDRIPRYRGRGNVARVLRDLDEATCDSMLEWDFRRDAKARGFRPYPKPFPWRCSDSRLIHIDVAFPEAWVACECNGLGAHSRRSHLTIQHKRQNRAVADGWRPFLIDWTRLKFDPDGLFGDLAALLATPVDRPPARPCL